MFLAEERCCCHWSDEARRRGANLLTVGRIIWLTLYHFTFITYHQNKLRPILGYAQVEEATAALKREATLARLNY